MDSMKSYGLVILMNRVLLMAVSSCTVSSMDRLVAAEV